MPEPYTRAEFEEKLRNDLELTPTGLKYETCEFWATAENVHVSIPFFTDDYQYMDTHLEWVRLNLAMMGVPKPPGSEQQKETPKNNQTGRGAGTPPPKGGSVQTIQIPMLEGTWPSFTAEFPMTKEKWNYMMGVLKTMEPQLVKSESPKPEEVEEDEE